MAELGAKATMASITELIRMPTRATRKPSIDSSRRSMASCEMRYFGGLSEEEIAQVLGVTSRTVRRDWQKARLLLAVAFR